MPVIANHQCHIYQAPTEVEVTNLYTGKISYIEGIPTSLRQDLLGYDSGVLCIVLGMIMLLVFSVRNFKTLFRSLFQDLWSIRQRDNVFDDRLGSDSGPVGILGLQVCVWEGFLQLGFINSDYHSLIGYYGLMPVVGTLIASALALYISQVLLYKILGYVFSDGTGSEQLLRGFGASQGLLGFALLFPALGMLFYPSAADVLAYVGLGLYIAARILFICKGFRIFYDNLSSFLYFFLYLCSVEFAPLFLLYRCIINEGFLI